MHHVRVVARLDGPLLDAVPPLLRLAAEADGHYPVGEHKLLRLRRGGDDRTLALLAYEGDLLVGYAHLVIYQEDGRRGSCELVVHPDHRRRGIGALLLDAAIRRAAGLGAARLDVWAYGHRPGSDQLAFRFGCVPRRRLLHLRRPLDGVLPEAPLPPGVTLRAFRPGRDEGPWLALNRRMFEGHPENGRWTREDLEGRMGQRWFDPQDFLLAEQAGTLAGCCWTKREDETLHAAGSGEIYVLGVAPEARCGGLGRALLAAGLRHLRDAGCGTAAVYVDEGNRPAAALYRGFGFSLHHVDTCYSLDLEPAAGTAGLTDEPAA